MATHLMIVVSNNTDNENVIKQHIGNYKTVNLIGQGYFLVSKDQEMHYLCARDPVAKTLKKWLTTNKKKLGIKKVEVMSDVVYKKQLGDWDVK